MADPQQPGFVSSVLRDTGQRMVPGGQSGRGEGRRSFTEIMGNILGSTLVPLPGGGSLGAELGERVAATPFGNVVNHPLQSLGSLFNRQREYTGPQLSHNLNTSIWDIGSLRANSPSYMGFGSGTGAFPYHGTPSQDGNFKPINLDYGQTVAPDTSVEGLPGLASPNTYEPADTQELSAAAANTAAPTNYVPPPNIVANMSGGGARDHFAGGGQSSARGGSSDWSNTFASLGMLGSQGGGLDPQRNRNVGHDRLRKTLHNQLKENPNDQKALAWLAQMHENAQAGK